MKIKIKALSPIHIGSGNRISPLEYISTNDEKITDVFTEDFVKLDMEGLFADPDFRPVMEKFISSAKQPGQRYIGNFLSPSLLFSHQLYKLSVSESAKGKNIIEVNEFIKSTGKTFLPGSSIKGALLSAVIHSVAKKKNIRNLNKYEEILKEVLNEVSYTKNGRFSHWLDVSDSNLLPPEKSLEISYVQAVDGQKSIPIVCETLKPSTEFEIEIKTEISTETKSIYKFGKLSCKDILKTSDEFYRKVFEKSKYKPSISQYGFLLRLGQGSSVLCTSLLLLAEELGIIGYNIPRPRGLSPLFPGKTPVTTKLIGGKLPMGWAEVQVL